jgi:hypothetical protein
MTLRYILCSGLGYLNVHETGRMEDAMVYMYRVIRKRMKGLTVL